MSTETAPSRSTGVPLTLALISLSIAVFLGAQIGVAGGQNRLIAFQMTNGETQIKGAKDNEVALKQLIEQQNGVVEQVNKVQSQYQNLFEDLLKLAEEDQDAKAVVDKWKIQRAPNANKDAAAAATPAPAAAPAAH